MKPKVGELVLMEFWDHCSRPGDMGNGPMLFEVCGRVLEAEKNYITVSPWVALEGSAANNTETYVIVRSTITKMRRLR